MAIANPEQANELTDAFRDKRGETVTEHVELMETRIDLERPVKPMDDPNEDELEKAKDEFVNGDGDIDELEQDLETAYTPPEERDVFVMTEERRVGSMAVPVEGHGNVRFGKPSGRASLDLLEPLEEMENSDAPMSALSGYLWPTLAAWSIDDDYDEDFWADEVSLLDTIKTLRSVGLGGNAQELQ